MPEHNLALPAHRKKLAMHVRISSIARFINKTIRRPMALAHGRRPCMTIERINMTSRFELDPRQQH